MVIVDVFCEWYSWSCDGEKVNASRSSSKVWCLFPASGETRRRSRGEYMAPPPLKSVLMAAWVSLHAALCLLMMWLVRCEHCPAMCVQESGKPQKGHASVGDSPYLYASLPLYSSP